MPLPGGIDRRPSLLHAEGMKSANRDDRASQGRGRQGPPPIPTCREGRREVLEVRRGHLGDVAQPTLIAPAEISMQISSIGLQGVACQAAFDREVIEVDPDRLMQPLRAPAQARISSTETTGKPNASPTAS